MGNHSRGAGPLVIAVLVSLAGCDLGSLATETVEGPPPDAAVAEVEVSEPPCLRGLETELRDPRGGVVTVSCAACHSLRTEHRVPETVDELGDVHRGLAFDHGDLACRACHDPDQADRLRLADGTSVEMAESLRLCGQCHGPQLRDWRGGSHGGMRGYWDRRRGPATKNHCVACHDAHSPAFPSYEPAPPPRDRFLAGGGGHDG